MPCSTQAPALEFLAADGAWYAGTAHFTGVSLQVHFLSYSEEEDENWLVSKFKTVDGVKKKIRVASQAMQDDQCTSISRGMALCVACKRSRSDCFEYYDAIVNQVRRSKHGVDFSGEEQCRCIFVVKWQSGPLKGRTSSVECGDICILSSGNIEDDAAVMALIKSVASSVEGKFQQKMVVYSISDDTKSKAIDLLSQKAHVRKEERMSGQNDIRNRGEKDGQDERSPECFRKAHYNGSLKGISSAIQRETDPPNKVNTYDNQYVNHLCVENFDDHRKKNTIQHVRHTNALEQLDSSSPCTSGQKRRGSNVVEKQIKRGKCRKRQLVRYKNRDVSINCTNLRAVRMTESLKSESPLNEIQERRTGESSDKPLHSGGLQNGDLSTETPIAENGAYHQTSLNRNRSACEITVELPREHEEHPGSSKEEPAGGIHFPSLSADFDDMYNATESFSRGVGQCLEGSRMESLLVNESNKSSIPGSDVSLASQCSGEDAQMEVNISPEYGGLSRAFGKTEFTSDETNYRMRLASLGFFPEQDTTAVERKHSVTVGSVLTDTKMADLDSLSVEDTGNVESASVHIACELKNLEMGAMPEQIFDAAPVKSAKLNQEPAFRTSDTPFKSAQMRLAKSSSKVDEELEVVDLEEEEEVTEASGLQELELKGSVRSMAANVATASNCDSSFGHFDMHVDMETKLASCIQKAADDFKPRFMETNFPVQTSHAVGRVSGARTDVHNKKDESNSSMQGRTLLSRLSVQHSDKDAAASSIGRLHSKFLKQASCIEDYVQDFGSGHSVPLFTNGSTGVLKSPADNGDRNRTGNRVWSDDNRVHNGEVKDFLVGDVSEKMKCICPQLCGACPEHSSPGLCASFTGGFREDRTYCSACRDISSRPHHNQTFSLPLCHKAVSHSGAHSYGHTPSYHHNGHSCLRSSQNFLCQASCCCACRGNLQGHVNYKELCPLLSSEYHPTRHQGYTYLDKVKEGLVTRDDNIHSRNGHVEGKSLTPHLLLIENLEKEVTPDDVFQLLSEVSPGVVSIFILPSLEYEIAAKGYAFYQDSRSAEVALSIFNGEKLFVVSSKGRPWVLSRVKDNFVGWFQFLGFTATTMYKGNGQGSSMVVGKHGGKGLWIIDYGTREYVSAKGKKALFLEQKKELGLCYRRFAREEEDLERREFVGS